MLFKPELVALILAGRKTQTRRIVRDGDRSTLFSPYHAIPQCRDFVQRNGRVLWEVGRIYAVQPGRGKHAVGRITITAIRYCSRASDISESDARAEGFSTAEEFRAVYGRLNGAASLDRPCWALTFVVV